jgi:hypothetical protein
MRRVLVVALGTIGCLIGGCAPALAVTVPKPRTKPFSEVEAGVMLSSTGLRFEDVYRIKRSPDGEGAAVRDGMFGGTAFPVSGTDTVTSNYEDGRQTAVETFTLGVPRLDGIGAITGGAAGARVEPTNTSWKSARTRSGGPTTCAPASSRSRSAGPTRG